VLLCLLFDVFEWILRLHGYICGQGEF
jgi:hypothetical protein